MKILAVAFILLQLTASHVFACNRFDEPEIKQRIESSDSIQEFVSTDKGHRIASTFPPDAQKQMSGARMIPLNPKDKNYSEDYQTTGRLEVSDPTGKYLGYATAFKISGSCILTSAHALYNKLHPKVQEGGKKIFNNKLAFVRGSGANTQVQNAEIFFQMTEEKTDFVYDDGNPEFYGDSDLVILRLKKSADASGYYSDPYYKKLHVITPKQLMEKMDFKLGRTMRCVGLPYHKTSKSYGACKGSDFLWHQDYARVFEQDTSDARSGMASNVASGHGMSGGHCALKDMPGKTNEIFGVVSNGFAGTIASPIMPNINFNRDYAGGNTNYLSLLHILNQRMKKELGFGLDQITEKCQ